MSADTIFALSSGRPPAAVSVIRVSGPAAHEAGRRLAGKLPRSRHAGLRRLRAAGGDTLDDALVLRFDGPQSSTGEDIVEFQCHGGRAIVEAVLGELASMTGLRPALPGEFTRRAFENGRIDLTEAEGLADLIEAETESQRKAALGMAEGGLRRQVEEWQQRLVQLSARAEAAIDYVDEDDVGPETALIEDCAALADELSGWIDRPRAEVLKDGVRVVVAGPPNTGKSSLINAIAGEERAIVTDLPGTTRDHIEVPLALEGIPVLLTDTAGIRETDQLVERIGVERARSLAERAEVLVWMGEPEDAPGGSHVITVHPRCDLAGRGSSPSNSVAVSSVTGEGLSSLVQLIGQKARAMLPGEGAVALNRRQADLVTAARDALRFGLAADDLVIAAESLRAARVAFDQLTGRAGMEDVLDALFGRFCLGK